MAPPAPKFGEQPSPPPDNAVVASTRLLCRVPITLSNGPSTPELVEQPRHAKNPAVGTKQQMRSSSLWLDQADAQVGLGWGLVHWFWFRTRNGWCSLNRPKRVVHPSLRRAP